MTLIFYSGRSYREDPFNYGVLLQGRLPEMINFMEVGNEVRTVLKPKG